MSRRRGGWCRRCGLMRGWSGRPSAADHPSPVGGRGVVAHPGAGPCGGLGGDCGGAARAGAARDVVAALGSTAFVARADAGRVAELSFWRGMLSAPSLALVAGAFDADRDIAGTARHVTLTLPASTTEALLRQVAAAFHGGINDVLLSALVVAVADWGRRRGLGGGPAVLLDLEGHGREEIFADVDLSRTVGWFTSLYPVRLDPGSIDLEEALAGGPALGRAVKSIKEQLRGLKDNGLGYGLLRYLNAPTASQLAGYAGRKLWLQLSGPLCGWCAGGLGGRRGGASAGGRGGCRDAAGARP